ncbi:MAG: hypothetical protein HW410_1539 [Nitrosarchaeum sp.]|nr:hypothetical protein [Nitrosarchaeum sp.]
MHYYIIVAPIVPHVEINRDDNLLLREKILSTNPEEIETRN